LALLAAGTIWLTVVRESIPPVRLHQVKVSGKVLLGVDDAGQTMWRREFPRSLEAFRPAFPPGLSRPTAIVDLDGDGTKEVLAGGCHNGYMRACLFVLDSRRVTGGSPQPDHPGYDCRKRRADSARYYLLFPRDPVLDRLHTFALVSPISVIPGTIIARIASGIASPPLSGTMDYILRPDLSLERAEASSDYEMLYRHLFRERMLSEPFSPAVVRNLDPILYWNGEQFTPQPAMNRHWKGQ
jgi:hypothetical protein